MIRVLAATLLVAASIAGPALAVDQPLPAQTEQPGAKADPAAVKTDKDNEIVCITEEETGTRLGAKRTCMTRAAYRQRALDARNALDDIRKDRGVTSK